MDGIDLALVRSDGNSFIERGPSGFVAYNKQTRQRIEEGLALAKPINNRLFFAGEACVPKWATQAAAAYISGENAAIKSIRAVK